MKKIVTYLLATLMLFSAFAQKQPKRDKAVIKTEKNLVGQFVYIPAGHFSISENLPSKITEPKTEATVSAFYMLETEVTNWAYNAFLEDLKAQGRTADYEKARIRSENWLTSKHYDVAAKDYFDNHPAYQHYPVVNVPYEGAVMFCEWLTAKIGNSEWEYMLPTRAEWMWAARGGNEGADFNIYSMGPFLTDSQGKPCYAYLHIGDESITMADSTYQVADNVVRYLSTPCPAKCFYANAYGLYNMCGNVAEMVSEQGVAVGGSWQDPGYDIRIASKKTYTEPTQQIGFRVMAKKVK